MKGRTVENQVRLETISIRVERALLDPRIADNAILRDTEWLAGQLRQSWVREETLEKALGGLLKNQDLQLGTDLSDAVEALRGAGPAPDETI